ncbi:MAG TPA: GNAT family N-acetyltransferase, partial [Chloroflexota bacterium]|nr:GNAT family N-acetyltransferase [Chloroflexota bacterium]
MNEPDYRRDLGDGLVLRWSTAADAPRIGDVVAEVFGSQEKPAEADRRSVLESFRPGYPHGGPGDWALVEHLPTGQIVSATALMRQTWTYGGIPFGVGRPEQVVTRKPYRDRGLTRAIFELLHARSAARGDLAQVIDGIPYFYRLFGYEYALESFGGVRLYWSAIDTDKVAERDEPYRLRDATLDDVPLLTRLHAQEQSDSLVSVQVDETYWRWVLDPETGQDHTTEHGWRPHVIVAAQTQTPAGCIVLRDGYHWSDASALAVASLAVESGAPLRDVLPSIQRALKRRLPTFPASMAGTPPMRLLILLGREHPVYTALDSDLVVPARRPYAWYVRVPNLPAFLTAIAPTLERRLAGSIFAGQTLS